MTSFVTRPRRYLVRREPPSEEELRRRGGPGPAGTSAEVVRAYAEMPDGSRRAVAHHVLHSPTGFEFGYVGSGPAELARCLLIDWFDAHDHAEDPQLRLPADYHEFAASFVATVSRSQPEWTITAAEIQGWVRTQLGEPAT
ncbi:MAG: DUF6166 domain-containing protein [Candidatus Limnocylindria bacterium]